MNRNYLKNPVYLDNCATTQIAPAVLDSMLPFLVTHYGNPSSTHSHGRTAKESIEKARQQVASLINAKPQEIYFTSGGTESNNWTLKGLLQNPQDSHIITTNIEHHSVLSTCKELQQQGCEVTYLPINKHGFITLDQVQQAIQNNTTLISVMSVNNEIGTIQPITQIGELCKEHNILLHTDAVQAAGKIGINVKSNKIDFLSLSGHKLHGPKGVGALYIREGVVLPSLLSGGEQENGNRAGTENVLGIVGTGTACELRKNKIQQYSIYLQELEERFMQGLEQAALDYKINGGSPRVHGVVNICFHGIEAETILLMLDLVGICVSTGSACHSSSLEPSHVLQALGLSEEDTRSSIRFSFSRYNTKDDVDYTIQQLRRIIHQLKHSTTT